MAICRSHGGTINYAGTRESGPGLRGALGVDLLRTINSSFVGRLTRDLQVCVVGVDFGGHVENFPSLPYNTCSMTRTSRLNDLEIPGAQSTLIRGKSSASQC